MTGEPDLLIRRHEAVSIVVLNRPRARNALTVPMIHGIGAAAVAAEADPGIRALLLTGAGDQAFSSGMDLRAFTSGEPFDEDHPAAAAYLRLSRGELRIPVVAAANGPALGGGFELLLGGDILVAADTATFAFPEVRRGLFPGGSGTALGTRIPMNIALELTLTGSPITATRGYELGLVNAVAPAEKVFDTALDYALRIAENAPLGLAACKELVRLAVTDSVKALGRLEYWQRAVFTSTDASEGTRAFLERRSPVWRGR
ncbi:enoyl-CoA hydratase-related protein [Nocardia shimofusensis]|uniref:enoyl-CoA hydratase-related protein n=1 Tax=Nocardia shimofusensis TaxID=228596 RepID=UPI00083311FD|nr:enoyl-CoA hydratase-related protein [Nocardia shimofusensis]